MSRKIAPFIDIVRHEDKETKLKSFIRTVVEQSTASTDANPSERLVLLIARSVESPVAKAVAALVRDGSITVPVKLILAVLPRENVEGGFDTLATLAGESGGRTVRDARLFDAHEQLVLGPSASWVGDCMRRDPMKRDAYECYAADCSITAGWARTSFNRMWSVCEDMAADARHVASDVVAGVIVASTEEASIDPLDTHSR